MTAPGDAITVGLRLPQLERTIRLVDMVAYAGATWDWHPLHYDATVAADLELPGPVVDGQVLGALLAEHVVDAFVPGARVRRMAFRFRAMVFAGETVRVEGEVTSVGDDPPGIVAVTQRVSVGDRTVIEGAVTTAELRL